MYHLWPCIVAPYNSGWQIVATSLHSVASCDPFVPSSVSFWSSMSIMCPTLPNESQDILRIIIWCFDKVTNKWLLQVPEIILAAVCRSSNLKSLACFSTEVIRLQASMCSEALHCCPIPSRWLFHATLQSSAILHPSQTLWLARLTKFTLLLYSLAHQSEKQYGITKASVEKHVKEFKLDEIVLAALCRSSNLKSWTCFQQRFL